MNRIKEIRVTIYVVESVFLALLTLCLALPFALIFREGSLRADLLWAFGTVIPVQLIRVVCERVKPKKRRVLICLGILVLSVLIPPMPVRRVYYGLSCLPILVTGLLLARPNGKLLLTVPKAPALLVGLLVYSLGKIGELPILSALAVGLSVMLLLDFLLYRNQTKLLASIYEDRDGHVSIRSLVSLNRKLVIGFLLIGMLLTAAIPQLLKVSDRAYDPSQYVRGDGQTVAPTLPEKEEIPPEDRVYQIGESKEWNFKLVETTFQILMYLFVGAAVFLAGVAVVHVLRSFLDGEEKHRKPQEDQFVVEHLSRKEREETPVEEEKSAYDKRIRRRYGRRILQTAGKRTDLSSMTPTELENAANLPQTEARSVIHSVYTKARYGAEPSTKEDYRALKDALHRLEKAPKA